MNESRERLLALSQAKDISRMSLREIAGSIGVKNPQTIKYHLGKLQEAGLLKDVQDGWSTSRVARNALGSSDLITIPILGAANCGPATHVATGEIEGYLKISSRLLKTRSYKDLFALRATGSSMDRANIDGQPIHEGDYVIVDGGKRTPRNGEYVVAIVDNLANIKKFLFDKVNQQIVLLSQSSENYLPIFIHPGDEQGELISGTVTQVIKRPPATGQKISNG